MVVGQWLIEVSVLIMVWSATGWDIFQRRIPNRLVIIGGAVGILLQLQVQGPVGLQAAILGLIAGIAILMPGYLMGFTGAGDVKLLGVVGGFLGPFSALAVGCLSLLAGGVVALFVACISVRSASPWARYGLMLRTFTTTGRPTYIAPRDGEAMGKRFPFAASIAIGTTAWMIWQWPLVQ